MGIVSPELVSPELGKRQRLLWWCDGGGGVMVRWGALGALAAVTLLAGCGWNNYGTDYCAAEGRRIPDREKIVRLMMRHDYLGYSWERFIKGDPNFDRWMAREASNSNDKWHAEVAINRYLDKYPKLIQIIGREPFVWNYDQDNYLRRALDRGYYADIVIMPFQNPEYAKFYEGGVRGNWHTRGRFGITNCGSFINWQRVGG